MITLNNPEAALFHALLLQIANQCEDVGRQSARLRQIASRLIPKDDTPEPNRSSHQS